MLRFCLVAIMALATTGCFQSDLERGLEVIVTDNRAYKMLAEADTGAAEGYRSDMVECLLDAHGSDGEDMPEVEWAKADNYVAFRLALHEASEDLSEEHGADSREFRRAQNKVKRELKDKFFGTEGLSPATVAETHFNLWATIAGACIQTADREAMAALKAAK